MLKWCDLCVKITNACFQMKTQHSNFINLYLFHLILSDPFKYLTLRSSRSHSRLYFTNGWCRSLYRTMFLPHGLLCVCWTIDQRHDSLRFSSLLYSQTRQEYQVLQGSVMNAQHVKRGKTISSRKLRYHASTVEASAVDYRSMGFVTEVKDQVGNS